MDLDDDELKATRRMNGSDKNVGSMKEDIKILENLLEEGFEAMCYLEAQAMEHLIKAYKELEEENEKYIVQLTDEQYRKLVDIIRNDVNKEWKSLVKEKIEEYEEKAKRIAGTYQYADSGDDLENKKKQVIELRTKAEGLQDFLEGK